MVTEEQAGDGKRIITDQEIVEQVSCAYRNYYQAYGCETPEMEAYCQDDCALKRKVLSK